jgi:hypothetical protein
MSEFDEKNISRPSTLAVYSACSANSSGAINQGVPTALVVINFTQVTKIEYDA